MNIPFLDLKKQYKEYEKEILDRLPGFLSDQKFILGEEVRLLEDEVAQTCGTNFGVGVSSGSDALIISLMALGIQREDRVVTTPFTFFATAGAISRLGAIPIFCDVDPVTFNLSPERLDDLLTAEIEDHGNTQIKAVIPVHLYGQCCDMNDILTLTDKYNLSVIEDAAQAIGTEYSTGEGTKQACGMGNCGILSFFPSKNLGAFGDGGMVLTNDGELAEKLRLLRVHGSTNKYFYETLGGNFRLDALQAMILRVKLKHLDGWIAGRMEKAAYYDRRFHESGLADKWIQPPAAVFKGCGGNRYHTYHQYVIRASRRDDLQGFLTDRGIASAIYYPLCLHQQKCFADLGYSTGDFPESEKAAAEVLALPIYGEMTEDQQEFIIGTIEDFYG